MTVVFRKLAAIAWHGTAFIDMSPLWMVFHDTGCHAMTLRWCARYGINKQSLNIIERAAFILCLEDLAPASWSEEGRSGLHGNGRNRWVDKSLTIVV